MTRHAVLALLLAAASLAVVCRAKSVGGVVDAPSAAADASASVADDAERGGGAGSVEAEKEALLPLEYFPLMQPFQRCLFICRYCYERQKARLLHCANDWCLSRVQKSLRLPARAYQECPAMRMIGLGSS